MYGHTMTWAVLSNASYLTAMVNAWVRRLSAVWLKLVKNRIRSTSVTVTRSVRLANQWSGTVRLANQWSGTVSLFVMSFSTYM